MKHIRPLQRSNSGFRLAGVFLIFLLSVFLPLLCHFSAAAITEKEEEAVSLTAEEQAWIDAHPRIRLAVDQYYEPRAYLDKNGVLQGISVEFVRLFEKKLGLKIQLVGSTWRKALDSALKYEVDGIMNAADLEERRRYLQFTDVYTASPQAVLANEGEPVISGLDALCGRKLGVTQKTSQNAYLRDNFPCIERVEVASTEDALVALSIGRVDAVINSYDVLITKSREMLLPVGKAIYLAYMPPAGFSRIGVRKDEPLLLSLLNKAIGSITEEERGRILAKWYGTDIPPPLASYVKQQEKLELSPEEQAWLAQDHTVRVRVVDFPPFIKVKEGQKPTGISIDYLNLIADRTGIKLKYIVSTRPFAEDLKSMQKLTGPDLITSMMRTPDREKTVLFSKDYLSMPRVIITRTDWQFISGMDDLIGRTIAVPRGTVIQKQIQERYPPIKLLLFDTDLKSLAAVATDQADAYVGNLTLASYLIERRGFSNLKVAAPSPFGDHVLSFGSRKDWPELSSIINKGLDSITSEEKAAIRSKHLKLKYEYGIKPGDIFKWALIIGGSAFLIFLLFLFWNRSLARRVRVRTSELTNSHKLLEAEIEERKLVEIDLRGTYAEIERLKNQLEAETAYLQEEIKLEHNFESIIGNSAAIRYVLFKVEEVSATDAAVLVLGETGTGKELVARAIHHHSLRRQRPLVKINCATLPANLIESELFGHERGAFTGANKQHFGLLEVANGSTTFLDEIGELPLELQTRLLEVLEDGQIKRLGSSRSFRIDIRVIAATNRNLEEAVRNGRFREDLFYRLNVFPITVPPLRERIDDIPLLAQYFVKRASKRLGKSIEHIPSGVMQTLQDYPWPGNVRELENVIERAAISSRGSKLSLAEELEQPAVARLPSPLKTMEEVEFEHIVRVLQQTNWKVSGKNGAAEILGLKRGTLRARMQKLGIRKP